MTDYLQRLVRSATRPSESIHPRTGSMFSPGTHSAVEEFDESVPSASLVDSPGGAPPESPETSPTSTATRTPRSGFPYAPLVAEVERAQGRRFSVGTEQTAWEFMPGQGPEEFRGRRANDFRKLATPATATGSSSTDSAEHSLLGMKREPAAYKSAFTPVTRVLHPALPAPEIRPARSAGPERKADDIQIHIGRIEVTAVAPPSTRAVKPPEKELSLDAYLKRREGRPR